jgi:hypothetical protein
MLELLHGCRLCLKRRSYSDPRGKEPGKGRRNYRATKALFSLCPSKLKCCPKTNTQDITREEHEDSRDFARRAAKSDFNPKAQAWRKKVEMLFAHLKRILNLGRFGLRGPCGIQDKFTLAAFSQNFRKLTVL